MRWDEDDDGDECKDGVGREKREKSRDRVAIGASACLPKDASERASEREGETHVRSFAPPLTLAFAEMRWDRKRHNENDANEPEPNPP